VVENTEAAILERLIEAPQRELSPEVARYILALDFHSVDHQRIEELAQRAQSGSLCADERSEVENYRRVSHILARMQSRARRVLTSNPQAA
jgi:hypothetical protein